MSGATIYISRKKFGQLDTDEVNRFKRLGTDNARLRKMLVDRDSGIDAHLDVLSSGV